MDSYNSSETIKSTEEHRSRSSSALFHPVCLVIGESIRFHFRNIYEIEFQHLTLNFFFLTEATMMKMKNILAMIVLVTVLSMEILAASLNSPKVQEETPAEERTFGLLALFAIWPAIKAFFTKMFLPAVTY